jgi:hypothetical protein
MAASNGMVAGVSLSGGKMLGYGGETYHKPRKQKGGLTWRCSKDKCSGVMQTDESGENVLKLTAHNHKEESSEPVEGKVVNRKPPSYVYTWTGTKEVDVWKCPECEGHLIVATSGETLASGTHTHPPSITLVLESNEKSEM